MAKITCGWCKTISHMTQVMLRGVQDTGPEMPLGMGAGGDALFFQTELQDDIYVLDSVFRCDNCGRLSVCSTVGRFNHNIFDGDLEDSTTSRWYPLPTTEVEFPDVPDHVAAAATEATLCLSVGAYRAVCALTRAVVEATAKDKGFTTQGIAPKIEAMQKAGLIRQKVADAATEVRYLGNDMAHGDFTDPVTRDEAEQAIDMMTMILNEVYQEDALIKKSQAARAARKDKGA